MSATLERRVTLHATPPVTPPTRLTWEEYVALEAVSAVKHDYYFGEVTEVAGATLEHNIICGNVILEFGSALRGTQCLVMPSDMKVKVPARVSYYPDVVVCCATPSVTWGDALQNPTLLVEVLSPTAAGNDRGRKFQQYRTIPSLCHILFVEQDRPFVEHWAKDGGETWALAAELSCLDQNLTLTLSDRPVNIALSEFYRFIVFADEQETAADTNDNADSDAVQEQSGAS